LALALCWGVHADLNKDIEDFRRTFKDTGAGGFSFNPSPFFCNSVPTFAPCAQPAIPICCGPCYQSGGVAAQPGGTGGTGPTPGGGTGGTGGQVAPPTTPFVPPPTAPAPVATAAPVAPAATPTPGAVATATDSCPIACPVGWNSWGPSEHCYLMPAQPAILDTFWNQQANCKKSEPTSYIVVVDGLAEQAVGSAIAFQYALNWAALGTNGFLWIGGYTDGKGGWKFLDDTDQSGSPLMVLANAIGSKENGTCLGADPKTLGAWQTRPCSDLTGAVICEMPKRPVCGPTGGMLPVTPINFTPESLKNLFPKAISLPFIGNLFGGGGNPAPGGGGGPLGGLAGALGDLA